MTVVVGSATPAARACSRLLRQGLAREGEEEEFAFACKLRFDDFQAAVEEVRCVGDGRESASSTSRHLAGKFAAKGWKVGRRESARFVHQRRDFALDEFDFILERQRACNFPPAAGRQRSSIGRRRGCWVRRHHRL